MAMTLSSLSKEMCLMYGTMHKFLTKVGSTLAVTRRLSPIPATSLPQLAHSGGPGTQDFHSATCHTCHAVTSLQAGYLEAIDGVSMQKKGLNK
ncbi:hypothetical protein JYU34_016842 [Plutella xylostella]|uniref:Uncharacterized protein n=1 Tax=Plutella xylostella TaxID=51655 RepID=A0ABQ7Q3X1_PLUXY|nr:hypothetical protein JYU34_016842 [Plutella xylostella]